MKNLETIKTLRNIALVFAASILIVIIGMRVIFFLYEYGMSVKSSECQDKYGDGSSAIEANGFANCVVQDKNTGKIKYYELDR